jgi:hypothetical protein
MRALNKILLQHAGNSFLALMGTNGKQCGPVQVLLQLRTYPDPCSSQCSWTLSVRLFFEPEVEDHWIPQGRPLKTPPQVTLWFTSDKKEREKERERERCS